jgi:DNA-binding CsgD family transcriptional regulator
MLLGRGPETSDIDQLLEAASRGRSGVLVVRGEAGIGKSTLLEHARSQARDMRVLRAVGIESESELPFAALHQLLHPVLDRTDRLPAPQAAALRGAFALSDERVEERFRVSLGVLSLLTTVAEERPLLCLVDDAQWMDQASADALLFAARRLVADPLALVFAARDEENRAPVLPGLPAVQLSPLDAGQARELALKYLGPHASAEAVEWVVDNANGNPLALVELPAALSGDQVAGRRSLLATLPPTTSVEKTYLQRIGDLPAETRDLLLLAATEETGDRSTIIRAAAHLGLDENALALAESRGLVRVGTSQIEFRHPLVRSAIYRSAAYTERERAHRALAAILSDPVDKDRRAWHRASATIGTDAETASELEETAERVRVRGGLMAASAALEKAAALSGEPDLRARRLSAAAEAAWSAGRSERARALLAEAAGTGSADQRIQVTKLLGRIEVRQGIFAEALTMLLSAAEKLAETDPGATVQLLLEAEEGALYTADTNTPVEIGRRAGSLVSRLPDGRQRSAALALVAIGQVYAGQFSQANPRLRDTVTRGSVSDDVDDMLFAARNASVLGEDVTAEKLCLRAEAAARGRGAVGDLPRILERLPFYEIRLGKFEAARIHAMEGLELARETGQETGVHLAEIAHVAAVQGREDECRAFAAEAMDRALERKSGLLAAMATWALGLLELSLGRPDEAVHRLRPVMQGGGSLTHPMIALFMTHDFVEAAARADRVDVALTSLAAFEDWSRAVDQRWAAGTLAHARGLLATGEQAESLLAEALRLHPRTVRPFEHARAALAYGAQLRRDRKRGRAREHLRTAMTIFEELGAEPWEERARAELRATGETINRGDPSALLRLTPQELRIARLVSDGLSNKDVAAHLFLSHRTVEYHLYKVFTKLGIASRAELARIELPTQRRDTVQSVP